MTNPANKDDWFRRLRPKSLRAQISLGFAGVLLLHLFVAVLSHVGLERAAEGAIESRLRNEELTRVLQTDQAVIALQRNVLAFMYTGDEHLAEYVKNTAAELEQGVTELMGTVTSEFGQESLSNMQHALRAYRSGFDSVVSDRGRRERIMRESVLPFAEESRRVLVEIIDEAGTRSEPDLVVEAGKCLQALSDANGAISSYMLEPGGQSVREFRAHASNSEEALAGLQQFSLSAPLQQRLEGVLRGIEAWENSVHQVVNSTRSYLHLGNVVLAGQAHEFLTLSKAITEASILDQQDQDAALLASQERYQTIANLIGALTVLGGLLAGFLISRSVSKPITSMTSTLSGLAQGREEHIAGTAREDEIGEMARAAEVFAQRNLETRELLDRANKLTEQQAVMNDELARSVEELEQRNEDLDSFSYSASHDLRAPLRGISLLASWIKEDAGESLNEVAAGHLDLLTQRVGRLEGLLEGLLEYSRSGRSLDAVEEVEVQPLVSETIDGLGFSDQVRFSVTGDEAHISTPRIALQKVIQNLVSNAVSHHDREDPRIDIRVKDRDAAVEIAIQDDGPGIPPDLHQRVFQIFQTLKARDEHESSGIGLTLVQKIARVHGAEVELHSDGENGCTFVVLWPKKPRSGAEPEGSSNREADPPLPSTSTSSRALDVSREIPEATS